MSLRFSIALLTLLALSSCANWYTPRTPMPIAEVVTLSKSAASPEEVIRRIRDSGTTYALRGSDFAKLKADGVPDPVLDFLQQSLVNDLDFLTRYWVLGGGLGACKFCYPQPVDVDKLESGFGVVPATPPGQYQTDKPTGAPDWLPPLLSPPTGAPVSISDVVKMVKDGVPEAQIVERIGTSRLEGVFGGSGVFTITTHPVAGLPGSELAHLYDQGVGYPILDALQTRFLSQFIWNQRMRYLNWGKGPGSMN
jgi:hypothetical protein